MLINEATRTNKICNGQSINLQQMTDIILGQQPHNLGSIRLHTLSYDMPLTEGNARKIHRHLQLLASEGVRVTVAVDNTYGRRVAPKSDLPIPIARLRGEGDVIDRVRATHAELRQNRNIDLVFSGGEKPPLFPLSKIDHRKAFVTYDRDNNPLEAMIFGSSVNYHFDSEESIGSALYFNDNSFLEWLKEYLLTPHYTQPTQRQEREYTVTTRELVSGGNKLADDEIARVIQRSSESILFSSQWLPDGNTLDLLAQAAYEGKRVEIYSNFPTISREPLYAFLRRNALYRIAKIAKETGNIRFYKPKSKSQFVHLNALISDRHSPTNATAITGTDNMTNQLVQNLGVRETLITLTEQFMVQSFTHFVRDNLESVCEELSLNQIHLVGRIYGDITHRRIAK